MAAERYRIELNDLSAWVLYDGDQEVDWFLTYEEAEAAQEALEQKGE